MTVDLLPRKEFELTLNSGEKVSGQFHTWVAKRFCDKKKLSLSQFVTAMGEDQVSFDDICQLILIAVEYKCRVNKVDFKYTDLDVCEWIEQMGGFASPQYGEFMAHFGGGIEEKKSETVSQ